MSKEKKDDCGLFAGQAKAMFDLAVSVNMKRLGVPTILDKIKDAAAKGKFSLEYNKKMNYEDADALCSILRALGFDVLDSQTAKGWSFDISWDEPYLLIINSYHC